MRFIAPLLALGLSTTFAMAEDCRVTAQVFPETTLSALADRHFGDVDFRFAILLATNARAGQNPYGFVGNPFKLTLGASLCIPHLEEATRLKNIFLTYEEAVQDMVLPVPSEVTDQLDPLPASGPVDVVTWVRAPQAAGYEAELGQTITAGGDIWVTEAPHLRTFCQKLVSGRGLAGEDLDLRIEQRLGLPPKAAKSHFVTLTVQSDAANSAIFRPCVSPDVTTSACELGPIPACSKPADTDDAAAMEAFEQCHAHRDFFLGQYYGAFGVSLPAEFPWTSLGYTFDWAHSKLQGGGSVDFERFGESEYVVRKGAAITVKSVTETDAYCAPG